MDIRERCVGTGAARASGKRGFRLLFFLSAIVRGWSRFVTVLGFRGGSESDDELWARVGGQPDISELPLSCALRGPVAGEEGLRDLELTLRRCDYACSDGYHDCR